MNSKDMKFGLIGHPIAHSLSPALFRAGYDGRYQYDLIETPDFEQAYERFIQEYDGVNVTAPFKELAFRKADILSEECRRIGAANLLIKTPEGVKAYNSDYRGVMIWLREVAEGLKRTPPTPSSWAPPPAARGVARFSAPLPPHTVLIVGLGGAGKAAAEAARSLGMEVRILNRTIYNNDIIPLDEFREEFRKADIVIYNLPVRIPQMDELSDEDFGAGQPKLVLEANYRNPSFDEELLSRMKKANPLARYTGGRTWLLLQALTGYELFTGEKPDLSRMSAQI